MGAEFSMNGFLKSVTEITQKENGFVIKIKGDDVRYKDVCFVLFQM